MTDEPEVTEFSSEEQLAELLAMLESEYLQERLIAIQILGEIGDLVALQKLRERLDPVNRELKKLVIAVGKLKRRLGVK